MGAYVDLSLPIPYVTLKVPLSPGLNPGDTGAFRGTWGLGGDMGAYVDLSLYSIWGSTL